METTIIIICESSDFVLFDWTIKDVNNTVLSLDPSAVSLDRRTAFIRKRTLPYGEYTLELVVRMHYSYTLKFTIVWLFKGACYDF